MAVGTPPGPDGSADLSYIFKAAEQVRRCAHRLGGHRDEVDGSGGHRRQDRSHRHRKRTKHEFAVASNPRVLEGGRRGQRLHEARPRGDWRRRQAGGRDAAGALRALHPHHRSHAGHGSTFGRADEVRRELHVGHAHLVHERPRQPVRAARRGHRARSQGHGLGRSNRTEVPVRRDRDSAAAVSRRTFARPSARGARSGTSSRSSTPSWR